MTFQEFGKEEGKTLMLLPGTCCNWETNFGTVVNELAEKYRLICVNGKRMRKLLVSFFEMSDETAEKFMECFAGFRPESILNEYYTDLITCLKDDIHVEHTKVHIIYALKMGKKYEKRYRKYFHDPDIREFAMQHEAWLFGDKKWEVPVMKAIDEFMEMEV